MKHTLIAIFLFTLLLPAVKVTAQHKPGNVCYISDNRIYFQLDKRWTDVQKKEFGDLFSLDSTLIDTALRSTGEITYDSITWLVTRFNTNINELSKPFISASAPVHSQDARLATNDVFLLDDGWYIKPLIHQLMVNYSEKIGINEFSEESGFRVANDTAYFLLSGFQKAGQVYLSGTFNNWSTMLTPMQKTGKGWQTGILLKPGKYLYKFIVDGRWLQDPDNLQKENDGNAGYNSVLYILNHVFELKGFEQAKKVSVAGSFNDWKPGKLKMERVPGGWNLPVFLQEGTHAYKFVVDKQWMTDPGNPVIRRDSYGNLNSFLGIGDTMIFRLNGFENARDVLLTGSFNGWSTSELQMNKVAGGWELPYVLAAGNFEYKFIVDGKWMPDPANPRTVGTGDFVNSLITFKPNHTFYLRHFSNAKSVLVTGSFNGWSKSSYQMEMKDGLWTYELNLKPGKHTYKFIVDGQWMIDPANEDWETNWEGTGNSVLWIDP
ncbi:MAG: glycogen-binding domain-containing protein [Bacteroidales bacterium]|nr:glycogen-binding domain-containing protein [Bacteroidales bacterium]